MEPVLNLLHAISLLGRFGFALFLVIRPGHFGKRTCLYRGVGLFALLGACLQTACDLLPYLVRLAWGIPAVSSPALFRTEGPARIGRDPLLATAVTITAPAFDLGVFEDGGVSQLQNPVDRVD